MPHAEPNAQRSQKRVACFNAGLFLVACWLLSAVPCAFAGQSVDVYANALEARFAQEPDPSTETKPAPEPTPAQWKVIDLENALKAQTVRMAEGPEIDELPVEIKLGKQGITILIAFGLLGLLVIRKGVEMLDRKVTAMANSSAAAVKLDGKISDDEKAFAEFVATFQATPASAAEDGTGKVKDFIVNARKMLEELRYRLQQIEEVAAGPDRTQRLLDVQRELRQLKGQAAVAAGFGLGAHAGSLGEKRAGTRFIRRTDSACIFP